MITHDKCGAFEEKIRELEGKLKEANKKLLWYHDRLIIKYGESENMDYHHTTRLQIQDK